MTRAARSVVGRLAAALLALLLAAACQVEVDGVSPDQAIDDLVDADDGGLTGEPTADPTVEPPQDGEDLEVPLEIVEGAEGAVLAFVPVMIAGEGPFSFALDTGASNSVIDEGIAAELGLEQVGEPRDVTGVTGDAEAVTVQIRSWETGGVDLGARPVIVIDLSGPGHSAGIEGLLGSDVLSAFGAVTVDYDAQVLRLRPRGE
jgi:hypothetical protein